MQINPTKLVGMFAVSAVLIGAAVFVTWLLFGRGLNSDVRRMLGVMSRLQTLTVKGEWADQARGAVPFFPPPAEEFTVHTGFAGPIDLRNKPAISTQQTFAVETSVRGAEMIGEYRQVDGVRYLYLKNPPDYNDVDLSDFAKQWIVIPQTISFSALSGNGWLKEFSADHWADLVQLISTIDLVEVSKTGIVEIINGDATLPYLFTIQRDGIKVFLANLWEMRHDQKIDAVTFQQIASQVDAWGSAEGTLWIGRKSFLLHRLTIKNGDQKLSLNFSDFNQPMEITTPGTDTDAQTVLGALGFNVAALPTSAESERRAPTSALGALTEEPAPVAENTDPDEDGMDNAFEFFYGTDPHNPDTDSDGLTDGYEVEHSMNPRGTGSIFSFGLPQ